MGDNEKEYFAREEAEKLRRLHADRLKEVDAEEKDKRKKLHWMHCPKCGWDLQTINWRDVEVEKCFHCGVIVLDDGEIERLAGEEVEGSMMRSLFAFFKD